MDSSTTWKPVGKGASTPSPAYFYMIDNLLESRMESSYPSNSEFFDEDVNVYLAGLLTSRIYSGGPGGAREVITTYDIPLFETVGRESDPRKRFTAYRANADDLLLRLAVFDNPTGRRPGSAPHMAMTREAWAGRGAAYYRLAWAAAAETFRRPTAIGDVMEKLSMGFDRYARVLSDMRASCLNMIPVLSDGQMFHLERSVLEEDRRKEVAAAYDTFLDALSAYRKSREPREKRRLEAAAGKLKRLDPSFNFDPSSTR